VASSRLRRRGAVIIGSTRLALVFGVYWLAAISQSAKMQAAFRVQTVLKPLLRAKNDFRFSAEVGAGLSGA
jgi:hypothetical protein